MDYFKILDPNENKFSYIISNLYCQTKNNLPIVFYSIKDLNQEDREKLLKWYSYFGDNRYNYSLSGDNLKGVLKCHL